MDKRRGDKPRKKKIRIPEKASTKNFGTKYAEPVHFDLMKLIDLGPWGCGKEEYEEEKEHNNERKQKSIEK